MATRAKTAAAPAKGRSNAATKQQKPDLGVKLAERPTANAHKKQKGLALKAPLTAVVQDPVDSAQQRSESGSDDKKVGSNAIDPQADSPRCRQTHCLSLIPTSCTSFRSGAAARLA